MLQKNILITGLPGTGKTTLIRKLAQEFRSFEPCGFFTEEMRERGARTGFRLACLDGKTRILAHADRSGPFRVGRYTVDLEGFEEFLEACSLSGSAGRIVIIDEIGKMECLSLRFRLLVTSLLDADRPLLATIALRGTGFIEQIKRRPDAALYELTGADRSSLERAIAARLRTVLPL